MDQRNASLAVWDASLQLRDSNYANFAPKVISTTMYPPSCAHLAVRDRMHMYRERLSVLHAGVGGLLQALAQQDVTLAGQDGIHQMVRLSVHNVPQGLSLLSRIHQHAIYVHMVVGSHSWGAQLATIVPLGFCPRKVVESSQTVQSASLATAMHCQGRRALNVQQAPLPMTLGPHNVMFVHLVHSRESLVPQCAKLVHKALSL